MVKVSAYIVICVILVLEVLGLLFSVGHQHWSGLLFLSLYGGTTYTLGVVGNEYERRNTCLNCLNEMNRED